MIGEQVFIKRSLLTEEAIKSSSVSQDDFSVVQRVKIKTPTTAESISERTIIDAYTSNAQGVKTTRNFQYVTIEMYISPSEGNPIQYVRSYNYWSSLCSLTVSLNENQTIESASKIYSAVNVVTD